MKLLALTLLTFLGTANAAIDRKFLDIKLPNQVVLEKQTISAPGASSGTAVLSGNAGPTSAAVVTVTSGLTNPDVARNLVITPGGTTADVGTCDITVSGTNILGESISEVFSFSANQATPTNGSKAFKTVTSVSWAASCEDSPYTASWSVGYGTKLGLNRCMADAGSFFSASFNGAYESTRPTVAASASAVESNTILLNSTLNGSDVKAYFVQNYRCLP